MTRRINLTPASAVKMRPVRWTWVDRLPVGAFCISAGRAGVGKSQQAAWLVARITRGTLPGVHHGRPRSVIYAATEDSWEMTIAPRLAAASADLERVYRVDVRTDTDGSAQLSLPVDTELLGTAIASYDVALIVLDPLLSLIDAGVNDYRAREVRAALEPLVTVADQTRCTVLGIAHFTKAVGADPLLLIAGSAGFGQLVRSALGFARDDESGTFVLSTIKNNLGREDLPSMQYTIEPVTIETEDGPSEVSRFVLGEESDRHVRDVLRDQSSTAPTDDERSERGEAAEWLRAYLIDHEGEALPAAAKAAAKAAGITTRTLERARHQVAQLDQHGFPARTVWRLADPVSPLSRQARHTHARGDAGETEDAAVIEMHPADHDSTHPTAPCGHPLKVTNSDNGRCALCIMGVTA